MKLITFDDPNDNDFIKSYKQLYRTFKESIPEGHYKIKENQIIMIKNLNELARGLDIQNNNNLENRNEFSSFKMYKIITEILCY